jgi:hypothetical protein
MAPAVPTTATIVEGMQARVAKLMAQDKLAEAERLLMAEVILQPKAGWVHLQLGEIYFRRIWRKDAEKEWVTALKLNPSLKGDASLSEHLCATLGPAWNGTGERLVLRHLGAEAVAPLTTCIRSTADLARVHVAARLIERVAGPGHVDRALVAARTAELSRHR